MSIAFSNYRLPEEVTVQDHAREIAAFAIGTTTKFEEIDVVEVLFQNSGPYSFVLDELMPARPQAEPATN